MKKENIVIAVSGTGRTLKNFLQEEKKKDSLYKVKGVISSNTECLANTIAKENNIPLYTENFTSSLKASKELINWLEETKAQWILLAGFLKIFPIYFEKKLQWKNKIINIHPSLLPKFSGKGMYGDKVHQKVLEAKEKKSGTSIHYATDEYDQGRIISQAIVKISKNENYKTLSKKIFDAEKKIYPDTLNKLIKKELPLPKNEVYIYD